MFLGQTVFEIFEKLISCRTNEPIEQTLPKPIPIARNAIAFRPMNVTVTGIVFYIAVYIYPEAVGTASVESCHKEGMERRRSLEGWLNESSEINKEPNNWVGQEKRCISQLENHGRLSVQETRGNWSPHSMSSRGLSHQFHKYNWLFYGTSTTKVISASTLCGQFKIIPKTHKD